LLVLEANASKAKEEGIVAHLLAIIPDPFMGPFAAGGTLR
jgi:hypothetical protein